MARHAVDNAVGREAAGAGPKEDGAHEGSAAAGHVHDAGASEVDEAMV